MSRCFLVLMFVVASGASAQTPNPIEVEGQPLAGNASRLMQAFDLLGAPLLNLEQTKALLQAGQAQDAATLQKILDPHVTFLVHLNPEARVKVKRGPGAAALQQGGYVPLLVKVHNECSYKGALRIVSPQALPIHSRGKAGEIKGDDVKNRFLDLEVVNKQPMTEKLGGLAVEYLLLLVHSTQAGKREAVFAFDIGQGTQDLGFRAEVPVLFEVKPAVPVKMIVRDVDGAPTTGRFTFKDSLGRVYPPQAKRLAPDFFFQQQVYRHSGGSVLLPPGPLTMIYGRGPEYRLRERAVTIAETTKEIEVKLERWIDPTRHGWYSGDHHIHAAGCAHYTNPTEGVFADDMFLHVKGEGMNVGCNLTWGPCFEFQRQFFEPKAHKLSEPFTVLKYDIEVSGFGSQALGHVCLLNLRDQEYPGSDGTKTKGWPTWTTPLMRWAKNQGAYTGYAHSANGLGINPKDATRRLFVACKKSPQDDALTREETDKTLLPEPFDVLDVNKDGKLSAAEIVAGHERAINQLPNYAIPEMNGIGAQEICVTSAQGLCDFISAMDTARIPEWNCWYHVMNCGFPLKASGETDFPCISGSRVGQGRVYVQLGKIDRIDFSTWAKGLAEGRSYVSDGYAHALEFTVAGQPAGAKVKLDAPGKVVVKAKVAFASEPLLGTAIGATLLEGKMRKVDVIVNGVAVATQNVSADDQEHEIVFSVDVERSSWIALRQFPQLHVNPVEVIVKDQPIRASRRSALWCLGTIEQLWRVRETAIAPAEREAARKTFEWAKDRYRAIAAECPPGS